MTARARDLVPVAVAAAVALLAAWTGLLTPAFSDYEVELEPSLHSLQALDMSGFLAGLPAYGGSAVIRAPFAFLPEAWGGGSTALYRSMAAPCLAAGALLGVLLWRRAAAAGTPLIGCLAALVLCAGSPLAVRALEMGHPEELLGGALCVGAALAAGARRPLTAGLLLGLAVANKPWAVLAIVPVVLMLPAGRIRALTAAATAAALVLLPLWVLGSPAIAQAGAVARGGGQIFQPWQVWWFLGEHGQPVMGLLGQKAGFRTPPGWIGDNARPLVVLVPLAVSMLVGLRWRGRPWHDGLLLLALVMLLRCLLDPWNVVYYELPFVLALVAWEVHARPGLPAISVAATLACWVTLDALTTVISPDAQAALFLAWSVPMAVLMTIRLLKPGALAIPRIGDAPGTAGGHGTGRMGHLIDPDRPITKTPTSRDRSPSAAVRRTSWRAGRVASTSNDAGVSGSTGAVRPRP